MAILARPNHPARLAGMFLASLAAFALLASAAVAGYVVAEREFGPFGAGAGAGASANVDLPPGMVLIRRLAGEDAWFAALGFRPVLPQALPEGVAPDAQLFRQEPDSTGAQVGHVRYSNEGGTLLVVLVEQRATLGETGDMQATETESGRAYVQWVACGTVAVQAQLFFSNDGPAPAPASATTSIAEEFVAGLRAACG